MSSVSHRILKYQNCEGRGKREEEGIQRFQLFCKGEKVVNTCIISEGL